MKVDVKQTVSELVEEPIRAEGYELADVVVSQYRSDVTVKLFVYGPQGVTIDECARLSRLTGDLIDGTDLFDNGYTLEVSSPGLDRPLVNARDFKYRVGEEVRVEFIDKARKKLRGRIIASVDDRVELKVDEEIVTLDLADIKSAQIVF